MQDPGSIELSERELNVGVKFKKEKVVVNQVKNIKKDEKRDEESDLECY